MEDLGNLIMRVNEQRILLENAQTTAETLKALESATKASKNVLKDNKISDVEKIMDDIASETDTMREVQDRLAEPVGFMADFDDDDLLAELEGENLDDELLQPNKVPEYNAGRIEASSMLVPKYNALFMCYLQSIKNYHLSRPQHCQIRKKKRKPMKRKNSKNWLLNLREDVYMLISEVCFLAQQADPLTI